MDWLKQDFTDLNYTYKNDDKNCPNCGAPIDSEKCPYCGTVFVDFAAVDANEPFFMKIKKNDQVFIVKVMLTNASMHNDSTDLYMGNHRYFISRGPTELTMEFTVIN